ncbi:unnamed protein product [Dicrocoelium dendriticum]|nr:unnamed protein product [Dicrocoelium dendriticum]
MSARNFTSENPMDDAAYRQVIDEYHDGASCSGSHVSHKIEHSIISRRSSAVMTVAELRKRQSDLDKQKRLVDLELEVAKLRVELEESNVRSNLKVISAPSSGERNQGIGAFVDQCQLSAAEAYDHRANRGRLVSQQCLQLDLPKVELEYFDGNPAKYWKFVKQFEYYVESRVFDSGQRLLYLIHYCRGYAKEAISECVMLPPSVAYDRARKVLRELFGESHVVARSLIDGLMTGLRPLSANPDELSKLSMKMENCYIALSQMNFTADLNSIATIERVVRVLPSSLQARWARVADSITHDGREVDFKDLADFVAAESRVARSRFGQIASSNASRQHLDARPPLVEHRRNDRSHVLYTWSGASPKTACLNCGSDHATASCRSFLSLDVPSRWRLMKSRGGCFRCLETGHKSATCQNSKECNVSDCRGHHHPLLHSESRQVTSPTVANTCTATFTAQQQVCLGVVPVRIESQRRLLETYALLDTGSNVTLVEEGLMEEAGIGVTPSRLEFTTMSGTSSIEAGYVGFTLSSLDGTASISVRQAYCLPRLPLEPIITPKRDLARQWPHMADIPFEEIRDSRIRILLGANVPEAHWHLEQRLGDRNHPFAVKTLLGWTLLGPVGEGRSAVDSVHDCHVSRPTAEEQLGRLCNNDFARVDTGDHALSVENKRTIAHVVTVSAEPPLYLAKAEPIINSRPPNLLTTIAVDQLVLTPNDLLILRSNTEGTAPAKLCNGSAQCCRQTNYLATLIWKRWSKEYLTLMHLKQRWPKLQRNVRHKDVDLITSDSHRRDSWPLAVVERGKTTQDGLVKTRSVRIYGLFARDVIKICLIEGSEWGKGSVPAVEAPQVGGGFSNLLPQGGPP